MASQDRDTDITRIILDRISQVETNLRNDIKDIHLKMDEKFEDVYKEIYGFKLEVKKVEFRHSECPGKKAEEKLTTKGMQVVQILANNPLLLLILIALLLGVNIYTLVTNLM